MSERLFEVAGECAMSGLPTGGDIERVGERLEQARRGAPQVVRTALQGPAAFKDRSYVLEGRFVVWADDGERAVVVVGNLLDGAKIPYRSLRLSGRALTDADAPRPSGRRSSAPPARKTAARPKVKAAGARSKKKSAAARPKKKAAARRRRR